MAGAGTAARTGRSGHDLLGIYLNDHLAGATGGLELARRVARSHRGPGAGAAVQRLAAEVAQDRAVLEDIMDALGIPVRGYKVYAAWIGEKATRLKLNGHLLARSPSAAWKSWKCCGWGWRARPRAGARCGFWRRWTSGSTPAGWMSSSPRPGVRRISSRSSVCAPRARLSAWDRQPVHPEQRRCGGVTFDVDGTLLDTNYQHAAA
jgi:hypothetical protein